MTASAISGCWKAATQQQGCMGGGMRARVCLWSPLAALSPRTCAVCVPPSRLSLATPSFSEVRHFVVQQLWGGVTSYAASKLPSAMHLPRQRDVHDNCWGRGLVGKRCNVILLVSARQVVFFFSYVRYIQHGSNNTVYQVALYIIAAV